MEPFKTHAAHCEAADNAAAGTSPSPGVTASILGECDAADSAAAGTSPSPEVTANTPGVYANQENNASSVSRLDAYNKFVAKSKQLYKNGRPKDLSISERVDVVYALFGNKLKPLDSITIENKKRLNRALSRFVERTDRKYKDCKRNSTFFLSKNEDWLKQSFLNDLPNDVMVADNVISFSSEIEESDNASPLHNEAQDSDNGNLESESAILTSSPKPAKYMSLSQQQKRRQRKSSTEKLNKEPPEKLVKASTETVMSSASTSGIAAQRGMELIRNTCIDHPEKAIEISKERNKSSSVITPKPYTPEEALGLIFETNMSIETYKFMQESLCSRGFHACPPYHLVLEAKKMCYPREIQVNEYEASVSLQALLNKTFERLIRTTDPVFIKYCEENRLPKLDCTFEVSWGFDGSLGQSPYKQCFEEDFDENNLIATTLVPLRITHKNRTLWMNPCAQSYRSCRPLHIQFRKETEALYLTEKEYIESQIKNLKPSFTYTSQNHLITAHSDLKLSMIDSKVLNIITKTKSHLRCPICELTATKFNNLALAYATPPKTTVFKHGLSPLYAWIRVLEFLLHLSYKNDPAVRQWRIRRDSPNGEIVAARKANIQKELQQQLGLLVDVAKPDSGTTNDGNTAITAMNDENRAQFSKILQLEPWLVDSLYNILVAISCGLPIDPEKFGNYCKDTAIKYVGWYGWHPMTVTVHKLLIHSKDIIESSTVPVGMLSEQTGELRDKFWRIDPEHHTREIDRSTTMLDLFRRALEISDPVISNIRLKQRQNKLFSLPPEIKNMLKISDKILINESEDIEEELECPTEYPVNDMDQDTLVLLQENEIFEEDEECD